MSNDAIRVVCRLRPLNKIQIAKQGVECVEHTDKEARIHVGGDENKYNFAFDRVFGANTEQVSVYKEVGVPSLKAVISGFNATIFAYGQTGGGKTWTMEGPNHYDPEFKGLIPRTIEGLFEGISECEEHLEFLIKCSYIEIYNEKLFDLLDQASKARLDIKQDKHRGVFIQNCTQICVGSAEHMLKTMDSGSSNRRVAFTGMNEQSSRSHSLFIIYLHQKNVKKDSTKQSKLYFVDLAGSEKVGKTGVMGQQLEEAKNINKSLSSLGNVINALTSDKKQHIPYRDSKLTRILQESLGGNSKTTLIINCSMCTYNDKETLSTLRFGYRAKSIKNKPKVNEQKSVKELLILLEAANKTIIELRQRKDGVPISEKQIQDKPDYEAQAKRIEELEQQLEDYKREDQERKAENLEIQVRIKNLLLELNEQQELRNSHMALCRSWQQQLRRHLQFVDKFLKRSQVDLEYWLNNLAMEKVPNSENVKETIESTVTNIDQYNTFYAQEIVPILQEMEQEQEEPQENEIQQKRRMRIALSQPVLSQASQEWQGDQMSVIQTKGLIAEDNTITNSDKLSQEESLTQIQTLLESLDTKESHKVLLEEMNYTLKSLKKENQELVIKCDRLNTEKQTIAQKKDEEYEQRITDLDERVGEYKNIIQQKDVEITQYNKKLDETKKQYMQEKVVGERLKKIIEGNTSLKNLYEMQERVRSLASERQKMFNEMYRLRSQLDEAQLTTKEQEQHIDSLKKVVKQLTELPESYETKHWPRQQQMEIQKKYNNQVYGTETPKVITTVKGGAGKVNSSPEHIESKLRKKVVPKSPGSSGYSIFNGLFGRG